MLEFKRLTLEHIEQLRPFFTHNAGRICDCTVGGTFMWRDYFETQFACTADTLWLKVRYCDGKPAFTVPLGNMDGALEALEEYCRESDMSMRFCMVAEKDVELLRSRYGDVCVYSAREWSDYLYLSSDICTLAGRRYSGQRNHINKFTRAYENWSFAPMTAENIPAVRAFLTQHIEANAKDSQTYDEGNEKTIEILDNFDTYGLIGGVLSVDSGIVGCAIGEVIGDTLFVHSERSDRAYAGSYQMLVNQFANMYVNEHIQYINREEDDGDQGLRTSKLSYHPVELIEKYSVCIGRFCRSSR